MNTEKRTVVGNGFKCTYTLIYKQVKNVNLHIDRDGHIYVSANPYIPLNKIDDFVISKCEWVLSKQQSIKKKQAIFNGASNHQMTYLGKTYQIEFIEGAHSSLKFSESKVTITATSEDKIDNVIESYIDKQCKKLFKDMIDLVYGMMKQDYQITCPTLKIRTMTSRWGSCVPSKNQITLNRKCIYYDIKFLEYVVVHEFAHLIQPNHSKQFYYIIEKYLPDYKERIKITH